MKKIKILVATVLMALSTNSFSEVRYVSDNLSIFLHSGPSLDYRIIGTLNAGEQVNALKYDDKTKFIQVESSAGKTGWMKVAQIQETLPAKQLLPELQKQLQEAQQKLKTIDDENVASLSEKEQLFEQQIILVDNLKQEKSLLQQEILDLKARNLELDLLQETKESRIQMEWLLNGGGVLFLGLVIGFLIPFLPRRKKRTNNW